MSTHPANWTVIAEMTSIFALSDAVLWATATNLAKRTIAVRPTSRPAHILLTVLARQTVGVVEADLDADPGVAPCTVRLRDAPLAQGTVCVCATLLETNISDTTVASGTT